MKNISAHKTGIITAVGDRRDEDISEIGKLAAAMYDRIIIRLDDNLRGKTEKEIVGLIESGIKTINPEFPYTVIHNTRDALKFALVSSTPGSYIVFSAENVMNGINMLTEFQDEYNEH
jgi:cyanophycin synthetase